MQLKLISDVETFNALYPEWLDLWDRTPNATPFQHPRWLTSWWKHFGSGDLHIVSFFEAQQLVAIVPAFRHEWEGRKQITLIGSGISDYLDPLIEDARALKLLANHLSTTHDWDVCDWQDLDTASPLFALKGASKQDETPCYEVPLGGSFDNFWATRSGELRRNERRYGERAAAVAAITFTASDATEVHLVDELIRLHALRWQARGESGMIVQNNSEPFLREVIAAFAQLGMSRILVLRLGEKTAAILVGFVCKGKFFCYMSALDPEWSELGFGRTLLYHGFRWAFAEGLDAWDFLRGEERYKQSWGGVKKPRSRLLLARASACEPGNKASGNQ